MCLCILGLNIRSHCLSLCAWAHNPEDCRRAVGKSSNVRRARCHCPQMCIDMRIRAERRGCTPACRFWQCPNGKECKYRHALPPGYVLKSQMKARAAP